VATAAGEETEQLDVAEAFVRLADDVDVGTRFAARRSPGSVTASTNSTI